LKDGLFFGVGLCGQTVFKRSKLYLEEKRMFVFDTSLIQKGVEKGGVSIFEMKTRFFFLK